MAKAKAQKRARGPSHWIHHGKIAFFSSRQTEWAQAKQNGCLQTFAVHMAHAYEIRYGGLNSLNDDLPDHVTPTMPTDTEIAAYAKQKAQELAALSPAEQVVVKDNNKKFREVSGLILPIDMDLPKGFRKSSSGIENIAPRRSPTIVPKFPTSSPISSSTPLVRVVVKLFRRSAICIGTSSLERQSVLRTGTS